MRWIPLADALAMVGGPGMWPPFCRAAAAGYVPTHLRFSDGRSSPIRCDLWAREPGLIHPDRSTIDWPEHPRNPDGPYNPAWRQYPADETRWHSMPVEVDRYSLLEVFGEPTAASARAGRKPGGESLAREISDAFWKMVDENRVSDARGGLSAAARELASQFPTYSAKYITALIRPEYRDFKAGKRKT